MANPAARPEDEDQTGVCWRDDQWLQFFPLTRQSALDYFSLSPFYDRSCNNEQAKLQGMDSSKLACAPWWVLFAVAWCTAVLLSAQCHSHLPASHFHLLPAAGNHLRLLKLTCCPPAALAFCFVCPKLMLAAWRSRPLVACVPQDAAAGDGVRAAGRAGAAPVCHLPPAAHRAARGGQAGGLLHPGRLRVPGALAARRAQLPYCARRPSPAHSACRGPALTGDAVSSLVASRLCVSLKVCIGCVRRRRSKRPRCLGGGVRLLQCLAAMGGCQSRWRPAQGRCLYYVRQAFRTMQADLDPVLKGAARPPGHRAPSAPAGVAGQRRSGGHPTRAPGSSPLRSAYLQSADWQRSVRI